MVFFDRAGIASVFRMQFTRQGVPWYLQGMKKKESAEWQVYLLRCADNTLYCGVTKNLEARIEKHNDGTASKYTRSRRPVTLIAQSPFMDKQAAFQMEYRIKRLPPDQKSGFVKKGKIPVR